MENTIKNIVQKIFLEIKNKRTEDFKTLNIFFLGTNHRCNPSFHYPDDPYNMNNKLIEILYSWFLEEDVEEIHANYDFIGIDGSLERSWPFIYSLTPDEKERVKKCKEPPSTEEKIVDNHSDLLNEFERCISEMSLPSDLLDSTMLDMREFFSTIEDNEKFHSFFTDIGGLMMKYRDIVKLFLRNKNINNKHMNEIKETIIRELDALPEDKTIYKKPILLGGMSYLLYHPV